MANVTFHVQFVSMVDDNFFCYVVPHHPRERIHEGCEHGHIHGTFD